MAENPERFEVGGLMNQVNGPLLTAAATIAPTYMIHRLTGTTQTTTITVPWTGFGGLVIIIPDGAWTTETTGNIKKAITATADQGIVFAYEPKTGLWYPIKY